MKMIKIPPYEVQDFRIESQRVVQLDVVILRSVSTKIVDTEKLHALQINL